MGKGCTRVRVAGDADTVVTVRDAVSPYFGFGAELAIGLTLPFELVRPWIELRSGSEIVTRAGPRWMRLVLTVGIEVGHLRRAVP